MTDPDTITLDAQTKKDDEMVKQPDSPTYTLSVPSPSIKGMRERVVWQSNDLDPTVTVVHIFKMSRKGKMTDRGWIELRFNKDADDLACNFDCMGWMAFQEKLGRATWELFNAQSDLDEGHDVTYR